LKPDRMDAEVKSMGRYGIFLVVSAAFFIAEMGDKTQVATVVLAAQFHALISVVLGTTLGMMVANVPVVLVGDALANRIPLGTVRVVAAMLFAALGGLVLLGYQAG